jgi:hypothetical protein
MCKKKKRGWVGVALRSMGVYMFARPLTVLTPEDTAALSQIG